MLKKIYTVFDRVLNIDPSVDTKRVLKSVWSGYDVKLSILESICPFLMIIAFVNKEQDKCTSIKVVP